MLRLECGKLKVQRELIMSTIRNLTVDELDTVAGGGFGGVGQTGAGAAGLSGGASTAGGSGGCKTTTVPSLVGYGPGLWVPEGPPKHVTICN